MVLLADYLKDKAKFYSPSPPDKGIQPYVADVNELEVISLSKHWRPTIALHDPGMVDSLISGLNNYLGSTQVDSKTLDPYFQPMVDCNGEGTVWQRNTIEVEARSMLDYVVSAAHRVMCIQGKNMRYYREASPDDPNYRSKTNSLRDCASGLKVLLEIKSPSVFEQVTASLSSVGHYVEWSLPPYQFQEILTKMIIREVAFKMATHKANFLALTCHDKWLFFHLRDDDRPLLTYSSVERQNENTRPFRALLGMISALEIGFPDRIGVNLNAQTLDSLDGMEEIESKYWPRWQPINEIRVKWSPTLYPDSKLLAFKPIDIGNEDCSSLGNGLVDFQIERVLGKGCTGIVYEATSSTVSPYRFALKVVRKGQTEDEFDCFGQIYNEFLTYRALEKARNNGKIENGVVRCYGLFETDSSLVLVLEYGGESLGDINWCTLTVGQRKSLLDTYRRIHSLGITHGGSQPRNVLRKDDGTFVIIDFAFSSVHKCKGVKQPIELGGSEEECLELKAMSIELTTTQPLPLSAMTILLGQIPITLQTVSHL